MTLRVASLLVPAVGQGSITPPDRVSVRRAGTILTTLAMIAIAASGRSLDGDAVIIAACLALLAFGLPHGSLDIALLRKSARLGFGSTCTTVSLYLAAGSAMYAVWELLPVLALALFLVVSVAHFAEDWRDDLSPLMAVGTASTLLTAPTLLHATTLDLIYVQLTGSADARLIVVMSTWLMPLAVLLATFGIVALAKDGHRSVPPKRRCR